ncbi:hypothetical protein AgCh_005159 [Apium graveolens]
MSGDHVTSLEEFDTTGMDSVWLAIKILRKTNDYRRTKLSKMEVARDEVVPSMVDEVIERKMLGPEVVQWTKDIVDLIRRWMTTTPGWIKEIKLVGGSLRLPSYSNHSKKGYRTHSKLKSTPEHSGKFSTRYTVVVM